MDLDLSDVNVTSIITCSIEGILEPGDLAALASGSLSAASVDDEVEETMEGLSGGGAPGDLKKLREKHHSVARLIASGLQQSLVATMSGYTPQYVGVLLNSPAMQELVELYRIQYGSSAQIIGEKLRTVALQGVEEIAARLSSEEGRKGMSANDLIGVAKLGLDRSGHGPQSSHHIVSENHNIDHAKLAELNAKAKEGSRDRIVPVREVRQALLPQPPHDEEEAR